MPPDPAGRAGSPLGLVAGGGMMPKRVVDAALKTGRPIFCILLDGYADPAEYRHVAHEVVPLGQIGRMTELLRGRGVRDLVLAGRVTRPSLLTFRFDAYGMKMIARLGKRAIFGGDDGLLSAVMGLIREEGLNPVGPQEVLADLMVEPGLLTRRGPDEVARRDIGRGIAVAQAMGVADVGQCCVVQQGLVLGIEGIDGTDALLARCAGLRREGPGGVLVKLVKLGQDVRADLPVIGPDTVRHAAAAGLAGIAIEGRAGNAGTLVVDRAETVAAAEAAGLFLLAVRPAEYLSGEGNQQ
jgi:DUF1009 family protein